MKPFLRWAGSKLQLIPSLTQYWKPSFDRYVEPFCGSACVFFSIQPKAAVLADLNSELIGALRQVQLASDTVSECLRRMKSDEKSYYRIRDLDPSEMSPNERAARFIYLNAHCFNGLYRTNRFGRFNVPYGKKIRKTPVDSETLRKASEALANAELHASDFEAIVNNTVDGDFLYVDPPYATSSQRIFNSYGQNPFSPSDLERLMVSLKAADKRGVRFVLSYADVPEIDAARTEWPSYLVTARRNIAGFAGARRSVNEVVVTNCE